MYKAITDFKILNYSTVHVGTHYTLTVSILIIALDSEHHTIDLNQPGFEGLVQGGNSTLGSSPSGTLKQEDTLQPQEDTLKPEEDTLRQLVCQQETAMRGSQQGLADGAFSRGSRKVRSNKLSLLCLITII